MGTDATSHFATVNGLRLRYVEWGDPSAPPIVALHGLRAYAHWFDEFADAVAARYRLIALDQRGRGDSDWAPDGAYTRPAYVADLEGLVDALGLGPFVLVGHSMGGLNSIYYAASHPDHVKALVCVDIGPDIDPAGIERIRKELGETPASFPSWDAAAAFTAQRHPGATPENRETRLRWMFREGAEGEIQWRLDPAIFDPSLRVDAPEDTWAAWRQVRCPALVLRGGITDILSAATCERMVREAPRSQWVEIPDAGHMVLEDNPDGFNAAVAAFLRGV